VPLWLRTSAIIALVLVGIVLSAALLGGTGITGRGGDHMQQPPNPGNPADHVPPAGGGH
jgi:hypothetical protein